MRWFWRADPPRLVRDGLLEGSLVGIVYLAITSFTNPAAPLTLVHFWLAAGAGLAISRLSFRRLRLEDSVLVLVLLGGVAGLLAEPSGGWLLGVAVFRGALHVDAGRETDVSTDAVMYSLPVIGVALLLRLGSGKPLTGPILVGSVVCVIAGMLAIGRGRQREFDALGPVTRGKSIWPAMSIGLVAWSAIAIPVAYLIGTIGMPIGSGAARWVAAMGRPMLALLAALVGPPLAALAAWFASVLSHLLSTDVPPLPQPTSGPGATFQPLPQGGGAAGSEAFVLWLAAVTLLAVAVMAALLVVYLRRSFSWRRAAMLDDAPTAAPPGQLDKRSVLTRFRPRLPRPGPLSRAAVQHRPTSAVAAYVALLDELADRGELARGPSETPRNHALRVGGSQELEPLPLSLLAADYQLAVYGKVAVTEHETARALGRWQRLRTLARLVPHQGDGWGTGPRDAP